MGSRLHGNDGRPRVPTVIPAKPVLRISVIPAQEDPCTTVIPTAYPVIPATAGIQGWRGWVPVFTGTTGGRASLPSFPPNQYFAFLSFPRRKTPAQPSFPRRRESRGGGDGFPSSRERRAAARPYRHSCQTSTSHFRHSRAGRPLHNRHSRDGGNPGVGRMGSRLHGNDGRPRVPTVIPAKPVLRISVIPAQEDPCTTVIPATAGIRRRRGWVPVSTGTTGGTPSPPQFHLPDASIPLTRHLTHVEVLAQPSFPPHTRHSHCTTVIPAKAGIQGWRGWVPVSTGTTGGAAPRRRRKSTFLARVYRIGVYENWKA